MATSACRWKTRSRNLVSSRNVAVSAESSFCKISRTLRQAGRPSARNSFNESRVKTVAAAVPGGRSLRRPASSNAARSTTSSPSATPIRAGPSLGLKTPNGRFSSGKCESRGTSMKDFSAIKKEDSAPANPPAVHRSCSCRTKLRIFGAP